MILYRNRLKFSPLLYFFHFFSKMVFVCQQVEAGENESYFSMEGIIKQETWVMVYFFGKRKKMKKN